MNKIEERIKLTIFTHLVVHKNLNMHTLHLPYKICKLFWDFLTKFLRKNYSKIKTTIELTSYDYNITQFFPFVKHFLSQYLT